MANRKKKGKTRPKTQRAVAKSGTGKGQEKSKNAGILSNPKLLKLLQWAIIIAFPFFLGLGILSLAVAEPYIRWEYNKSDFPIDRYGFSQQERYELALMAVNFLRSSQPADEAIALLENQRLPGTTDPLYNEREIGHMLDVKVVLDGLIRPLTQLAALIVILGLGLLLYQPHSRPVAYQAIYRGGMATTAILLAIALFILIGWSIFFVAFHDLLFPPGTWTFAYSDSLIRLFPEKLFFDWGVLVSVGALTAGILTSLIGYFLRKKV